MGRGLLAAVSRSAVDDDQKSSWPEMVGTHFVEAAFVIKSERPAGRHIVEFHTADDPQPPQDFDAHRICVFVDANLIVVRTPVVG
nr:putative proteinase inhibitor I13, potato inhibitor I [Saccharum hybrid cultivar R570]